MVGVWILIGLTIEDPDTAGEIQGGSVRIRITTLALILTNKKNFVFSFCFRAGILFVVREVLPVASNWRYEKPGQREQILQLSLAAVLQYVTAVPEGERYSC